MSHPDAFKEIKPKEKLKHAKIPERNTDIHLSIKLDRDTYAKLKYALIQNNDTKKKMFRRAVDAYILRYSDV